jgi:hypothetical protein
MKVIKQIFSFIKLNKKLIMVTFEIFWLLVFMFDRLTSMSSVDIPQFIYVQF